MTRPLEHKHATGSVDLIRQAGITYRQLDYWTTRGLIPGAEAQPIGSGTFRVWSPDQVKYVWALGVLVRARIPLALAAGRMATELARDGETYYQTDDVTFCIVANREGERPAPQRSSA